jgi:cytochrome P450
VSQWVLKSLLYQDGALMHAWVWPSPSGNIAQASAFCVPGDAMQDTTSELRQVRANAVLAVQALGKVGLMPWKAWFWWLWPDMRRVMTAGRHNREFMRRTLQTYRSAPHATSDRSVLGHLVRAPYASDEERIQDMLVFMTAGHDTTAGTLTLALMDLAESPHVLARVAVRDDHLREPFVWRVKGRGCSP